MKKLFLIILSTALLILSAFMFDYIVNLKETKVSVYSITPTVIQESFYINGKTENTGKFSFIEGNVADPLNIKEGAQASVYINGDYYDGYLQSLNKTENSSSYTAKVSIITDKKLSGNAEAYVYGKLNKNALLIPSSGIFRDEAGKECVMIATKDYCVKRNILSSKIIGSDKILIKEGLFPEEKIILNPKGLETGDRISYGN